MCEKDFPLWRLRSLAYSTTAISLTEKWEIKKGKGKKEREVDTIKLFTNFLPPPNKKIRNRRMEQRIHVVSYPLTSSKTIFFERIPFHSIYPLLTFIYLKEDFAFGIRPSDDGAIFAPSSQLGPVHLHIKIIKWKRATLFVLLMILRFMFKHHLKVRKK